jgi:2-amino-4-hydroxy-6-hydroxymethyldihydropteridine diphosphokinase
VSRRRPYWRPAYIGIGSNLDSPRQQVERAIAALGGIEDTVLVRTSPLYRSAPVDGSEQPDYVNAVSAILTRLDAAALFAALREIERAQGRRRDGSKWGPRPIDLDLLVFSGKSIDEKDLTVPHPRIKDRNFVLLPLFDIAPQLRVPGLGTVASLAGAVSRTEPRIEKLT